MNDSTAQSHLNYRPDIDGLRGLSILGVVLFHFFGIRGGYAGVDVFFVISGYLITRILLDDLNQNKLSIQSFYAGRIRRIFPALATLLIICFLFSRL